MPPTLAQLRTSVSRDLRDTGNRTFLTAYVNDLINAGIEEVGRLYPVETIDSIDVAASTYAYATTLQQAFRCEVWRSGAFSALIPQAEEDSQSGWDLFAGQLLLPKGIIDGLVPATDDLHLWGYDQRIQLVNDNDVSDLDSTAEWGVRHYARAQAFTLMNNDRALFKQWQGQSNNTDVTLSQLSQMVSLYTSEWDRQRNYLRRLRRT
jgi:hypothetical protein